MDVDDINTDTIYQDNLRLRARAGLLAPAIEVMLYHYVANDSTVRRYSIVTKWWFILPVSGVVIAEGAGYRTLEPWIGREALLPAAQRRNAIIELMRGRRESVHIARQQKR